VILRQSDHLGVGFGLLRDTTGRGVDEAEYGSLILKNGDRRRLAGHVDAGISAAGIGPEERPLAVWVTPTGNLPEGSIGRRTHVEVRGSIGSTADTDVRSSTGFQRVSKSKICDCEDEDPRGWDSYGVAAATPLRASE